MGTKRKKINVAVTGLNAIDSPGPGVPVIRALRESKLFDVRIIGLSYETLEPGIYMHDLVDKTYQIPFPSSGKASLMTRLKYIHGIEKLDVIIPNFDAELFNFIKLGDQLKKEMGIRTFLPTIDQFEERHKSNLPEFGKTHKIKVPYSKMIFSTSEIPSLSQEFSYPLVVKGKFYDASIAYTPEQVVTHFNKISAKWGLPIIIQQFVYGQEVNVTAIGDGLGNTVGAVAMRKQYITDKGKAWSGISINDAELMKITRKLIKSTKWRGGMELEIIKNSEGDYYLLEINPRFPAWVYLAVGCGQNHPEALVQMALGEKVKPWNKYDIGKLFVRYSYDLIVGLNEFEKISTLGEL
ncbi:MAG TPA: ATP-grasp domain-containing protein [Bacteroidia bacterium]|jgi:carbamoyl-phosphate synthase large subunit|nr:ATP-grasp domain-containing protein [Bacteroidia bacterium]